ncbi:MAG: hypothetical protein ACOY93_13595 [Bacillota bacterium]
MTYERVAHEVLEVQVVDTETQRAIVRRHHTMFAHVSLTAPTNTAVGETIAVNVQLVRWDDLSPITDEERDLAILVDDVEVDRLTTATGAATYSLRFDTAGTYRVQATGDKVTGAEVEVTVG